MIEAFWSALDFWQRFGVIVLTLNIPIGIVLNIVGMSQLLIFLNIPLLIF